MYAKFMVGGSPIFNYFTELSITKIINIKYDFKMQINIYKYKSIMTIQIFYAKEI